MMGTIFCEVDRVDYVNLRMGIQAPLQDTATATQTFENKYWVNNGIYPFAFCNGEIMLTFKFYRSLLFAALATPLFTGCGGVANSEPGGQHPPTSSGGIIIAPPDTPLPPTDPVVGDKYTSVGTNPFVSTIHDPLSTFAADVDSASYDIFRRDINNYNVLPNSNSVRLEEYVNYFHYDYPVPQADAEHPFVITVDAAPHILDRDTQIMRVGIQAKKSLIEEHKGANLVFLVDVSGSMGTPEKLPLVKQLLSESLDILDPSDRVSIVTYASGTALRLEPTEVASKEEIRNVIQSLVASGGTYGAGGIQLAYEQAADGFIEGGINHVMLCSDGDFNVGASSTEALIQLIEEKRKTGVTFTALGFGRGNLNDAMLEATSNAGNGTYAVISSATQASQYVTERLLSNIQFVAKDMKIQVEFNPTMVSAYRLLGYENRNVLDGDFRDDQVDAGEVGAGHSVTALYELVMNGHSVPVVDNAPPMVDGAEYTGEVDINAEAIAIIRVRYKNIDATEADPAVEVTTTLDTIEANIDLVDADFRWAVATAAFAEILKQSPYGDSRFIEQIASIVDEQKTRDQDRTEFANLFAKARLKLGL
jgi:Ca-activated chloride channel homolog